MGKNNNAQSAPKKYPIRLNDHSEMVAIRLPHPMGGSAKIYLRNVAKEIKRLYHLSIETGISGHTDSGEAIPIDTLGKWLFGTPGYMGHIRVSNWDGCDAKVEYPKNSPPEVVELIAEIKKRVESK